MTGLIMLATFLVVWIGFAAYGSKQGWSTISSFGGGFILGLLAIIAVTLIADPGTMTSSSSAPPAPQRTFPAATRTQVDRMNAFILAPFFVLGPKIAFLNL